MADRSPGRNQVPEIERELEASGDPDARPLAELAEAIARIRAESTGTFDREAIWSSVERHLDQPDERSDPAE